MKTHVNLGDLCEDTVSGFKGVVTARYEFLNGCIRIELQPKVKKDGTKSDSHVVDHQQLKVLKTRVVEPYAEYNDSEQVARPKVATGGPRSSDPVRSSKPVSRR